MVDKVVAAVWLNLRDEVEVQGLERGDGVEAELDRRRVRCSGGSEVRSDALGGGEEAAQGRHIRKSQVRRGRRAQEPRLGRKGGEGRGGGGQALAHTCIQHARVKNAAHKYEVNTRV